MKSPARPYRQCFALHVDLANRSGHDELLSPVVFSGQIANSFQTATNFSDSRPHGAVTSTGFGATNTSGGFGSGGNTGGGLFGNNSSNNNTGFGSGGMFSSWGFRKTLLDRQTLLFHKYFACNTCEMGWVLFPISLVVSRCSFEALICSRFF